MNVLEYPYVFFPVGLNLRGRRCVVIGNDHEAVEKVAALREVGADVFRIVDATNLREEDVRTAFLVISTPQDEVLSARIREWADRNRFLFCAIDQPRHGFVAMQALAKAGPVRIAVSTGGISPRVGGILRAALQRVLDKRFERFIACLSAQRERNRLRLEESEERRRVMRQAAEGFEVDVTVRFPKWFREELEACGPQLVECYERRD
ncbi:MAG TPA: NAD(P)-dependent oxidoreductase [Candidatus Baltobacteraceae bacterium]|jgi:siroheme synthase (precorrin-2 oxidase/ferrochelatase)|nr:NAD(P)-dependent oxidoreductase [Candidatus Baltobacteraceae bacterium]